MGAVTCETFYLDTCAREGTHTDMFTCDVFLCLIVYMHLVASNIGE